MFLYNNKLEVDVVTFGNDRGEGRQRGVSNHPTKGQKIMKNEISENDA